MEKMPALLDRHRAFWMREPQKTPLLRLDQYHVSRDGLAPMRLPLPDGALAPEGGALTPEMLSPEAIHAAYGPDAELAAFGRTLGAQETRALPAQPAMRGDLFAPAAAYSKAPWMEAILGCSLRVSLQSHSIWAAPFVTPEELRSCQINPDPRWMQKLLEFTRWLAENAGGRYLVAHTLMRSVSDMLVAMLGDELFCRALYDAPEAVHRLADQCAALFENVVWAQLALIPPYEGGYCSLFGIWAPGTSVRSQDDAATLLSPRHYAEFILPYQQRIARSFGYSTIHLHSTCLHVADLLCDSDFSAIQVSVDPVPFGPPMRALLPQLARILEKKPLLIEGPMTQAELNEALRVLPSAGLFIGASIEAEEDRPV